MIVYWIALAETLFYLCAVPLYVAVYFRAGSGVRAAAGFALFEKRFARRRAARRMQKRAPGKKSAPDLRRARLALRLLTGLRRGSLRVSGSFSAGDAGTTALVSGAFSALEAVLRPFMPGVRIAPVPDFNAAGSYAELCGMIRLNSGQIILAAISGPLKNTRRRIKQWTSIRSKA